MALRRKSEKRAALEREWGPKRREFVEAAGMCMAQPCGNSACDCHEICRGAARERAYQEPRLWLALCRPCHESMDSLSDWPIAKQLAVRAIWEMRRSVWLCNDVRGRAQTDTEIEDVVEWIVDILQEEEC